jgi:hypothetical protein
MLNVLLWFELDDRVVDTEFRVLRIKPDGLV